MRLLITAAAAVLLGCTQAASTTPQTAEGDTPVRYIICGPAHCFVAARFSTIDGCESHKKWSGMLCVHEPGRMICREDDKPVSSAYCTM